MLSPASGFSDSESDTGSGPFLTHPAYCPAHGPIGGLNGPLRHLPLPYPLLPPLQEGSGYGSETFDEGGSTISSHNSEDLLNVSVMYDKDFEDPGPRSVQTWRLNQLRGIQRSDAVYMSDDAKSSGASSPSRICPRCLEKEGYISKQSSLASGGVQFDSGVDSMETVKNVSFDTVTSSEVSLGRFLPPPSLANFNNASIQTDLSGTGSGTGESTTTTDNTFCTTVTTFGVKENPQQRSTLKAGKATDV